jgi:hypothetical protein
MMQDALKDHNKMIYILKQRNEILNNLLKYWRSNDLNSTVNSLIMIKDTNIMVDALNCTFGDQQSRIDMLSFDHASLVLKKCEEVMLSDKFEFHLTVALKVVKNILKVFNERINTIMKTSLAMGDDFQKLNNEQ